MTILSYATEPEYRHYIQEGGDDADFLKNLDALEASSRFWDRKLGHNPGAFLPPDEVKTRSFYVARAPNGNGSRSLFVDNIATKDDLVIIVDGVEVDADSYELRPLNAEADSEAYDLIHRPSGWPLGKRIDVTAFWGYPEIPALIKLLTMEWAAVWQGKSRRATATMEQLDQVENTSVWHQSQIKRAGELFRAGRKPTAGVL